MHRLFKIGNIAYAALKRLLRCRHEHSGRDAFARYVSDHNTKLVLPEEEIVVKVSADLFCRLHQSAYAEFISSGVLFIDRRKQRSLDDPRSLQVRLDPALFYRHHPLLFHETQHEYQKSEPQRVDEYERNGDPLDYREGCLKRLHHDEKESDMEHLRDYSRYECYPRVYQIPVIFAREYAAYSSYAACGYDARLRGDAPDPEAVGAGDQARYEAADRTAHEAREHRSHISDSDQRSLEFHS